MKIAENSIFVTDLGFIVAMAYLLLRITTQNMGSKDLEVLISETDEGLKIGIDHPFISSSLSLPLNLDRKRKSFEIFMMMRGE